MNLSWTSSWFKAPFKLHTAMHVCVCLALNTYIKVDSEEYLGTVSFSWNSTCLVLFNANHLQLSSPSHLPLLSFLLSSFFPLSHMLFLNFSFYCISSPCLFWGTGLCLPSCKHLSAHILSLTAPSLCLWSCLSVGGQGLFGKNPSQWVNGNVAMETDTHTVHTHSLPFLTVQFLPFCILDFV